MIRSSRQVATVELAKPAQLSRSQHTISPEIVVGLIKLADFGIVLLAAISAFTFYNIGYLGEHTPYDNYALVSLIAAIFYVTAMDRVRLYEFARLSSFRWQAIRGFLVWGATASLLLLVAFITKISSDYSRGWAIVWSFGVYGLFLLERLVLWATIRSWARHGHLVRNIVVVGTGEAAQRLIVKLLRLPPTEVAVVGVFDIRGGRSASQVEGCPVMGDIEDLLRYSQEVPIDEVIVALPLTTSERAARLVFERLGQMPVDIRLSMEPLTEAFPIRGITFHGETPVIEVIDRPLRHWNALTKWFEDKVLCVLLLILFAPFMLVLAALIKLDSPGPVFFAQERYGFNNQVFRVLKFRTMHVALSDVSGATRTVRNDPRLTRIGRILRTFSLDELPQLVNVVAGQMSLVGPRPHAVGMRAGSQLYHEAVHRYFERHRVKPGITGWSQVNGLRGEIDTVEKAQARVRHDLYYIEHWSIWLDLKILLMTFRVITSRENAY